LIPELLFKTKTLVSITCTGEGQNASIVTLERADSEFTELDSVVAVPTQFRAFKVFTRHPTFQEVSAVLAVMPQARSATALLFGESLLCLYEINSAHASAFAQWKLSGSLELAALTNIDISRALARTVAIQQSDEWSTSGLSARQWLFHPRLSRGFENQFFASYNLADARAIIWELSSSNGASQPFAVLPGVLDPIVLRTKSRLLVSWRKPTSGWEVYSNTRSYNRDGGAQQLPLFLSELRGNRLITDEVSGGSESIAEPLIYEGASDGDLRIVFAVVDGTFSQPVLKLLLSENGGTSFANVGTLKLEKMPIQISVAVYKSGLIVGLAMQRGPMCEVHGIQLSV
jgi:hypothetical protein